MNEPGMLRRWVDEVRKVHLADPTQPLELRRSQYRPLEFVQFDLVVNRIPNRLPAVYEPTQQSIGTGRRAARHTRT